MGLIRDIAGAALAPATGGASLAMTGKRSKRTGSTNTDDPGAPGQDAGDTGSDDSSGGSALAGIAKRIGRRLATKRS